MILLVKYHGILMPLANEASRMALLSDQMPGIGAIELKILVLLVILVENEFWRILSSIENEGVEHIGI